MTPEELAAKAAADEEAAKKAAVEEGDGEKGGEEIPDPVEASARTKGWKPKEEWNGSPDEWVDAGEFMRRGPLFDRLDTQKKTMRRLEQTVDAMATHFKKNVDAAVNQRIDELKAIAFACRFPDNAIDQMIECELIRVDDECAWSDSLDRRMGELDKI